MGVESRLGAMNTIVEKNITLLQRKLATDRSIFFPTVRLIGVARTDPPDRP